MAPIAHRAAGIHDHPHYKTGRRPPKNAPALFAADFLTGVTPAHPAITDHIAKNEFGLYGNDRYGVCGPTDVANTVRLVSVGLLGQEIKPSQEDVFDLYRRSGNPDFDPNKIDPNTGEAQGDNGVDMQTMYEALLSGGIGDGKGGTIKPLCFAKLDVSNDAELDAAVSIFGSTSWGVNLLTAQQEQTDAQPPKWDYVRSGEWGGHAVMNGAYDENRKLEDVISWNIRVETTEAFRRRQLEEAWVVIWEWNLDHPAFQEGVDLQALADAYHALTGKTIPNLPDPTPVPPTPSPTPPPPPAPGGSGDGPFLVGPFSDRVAARLADRAAKRNMTIEQYLTYHIQTGSGHWKN